MKRSTWGAWALVAIGAAIGADSASACHTCAKVPCAVPPPRPAYECVTEMVPYTVMRPHKRVELIPYTKTVTVKEPHTTFTPRQRVVCRPVVETTYVPRQRVVCRPVVETSYVNQTVTECRPVSTVRQVTQVCLQPSTRLVTVPTYAKVCCGMGWLCGKLHGGHCGGLTPTGCATVTETCYTPVPVVRNVVETRMVTETRVVQVPVHCTRMVQEVITEQVPVHHRRMVQEVITEQVPHTRMVCVTKTITCYRRVKVCEMVAETRYRRVKRLVPVSHCEVGPIAGPVLPAGQGAPLPIGQDLASAYAAGQAAHATKQDGSAAPNLIGH